MCVFVCVPHLPSPQTLYAQRSQCHDQVHGLCCYYVRQLASQRPCLPRLDYKYWGPEEQQGTCEEADQSGELQTAHSGTRNAQNHACRTECGTQQTKAHDNKRETPQTVMQTADWRTQQYSSTQVGASDWQRQHLCAGCIGIRFGMPHGRALSNLQRCRSKMMEAQVRTCFSAHASYSGPCFQRHAWRMRAQKPGRGSLSVGPPGAN